MSVDEVLARLAPYMLRHIVAHKRYQIASLVWRPRRAVRMIPHEPWLRAPSVEHETPLPMVDAAKAPAEPVAAASPDSPVGT